MNDERPTAAPPSVQVELERLLGAWYLLFSNRGEWRSRSHPRLDHEAITELEGRPALASTLRFASADLLGRAKLRATKMIAVVEPGEDGRAARFEVRGPTLARVAHARFRVVLFEPDERWLVVWHERSRLGTGAGIDIHSRDPSLPQARVDRILAALAADPRLRSRSAGLYATTQHWFPPTPYRLSLPDTPSAQSTP